MCANGAMRRESEREASRASVLKHALIYVILIEFTKDKADMAAVTPSSSS